MGPKKIRVDPHTV